MITVALVLVALYRIGTVVLQRAICVVAVEGGADSCGWRRVAVADEISASATSADPAEGRASAIIRYGRDHIETDADRLCPCVNRRPEPCSAMH